MTTIAYKDGVLASDSRATWDDASSKCVKMWKFTSKVDPVKGEVLLAVAGDLYAALLFKDWMMEGGKPDLHSRGVDESNDFDALIVHKSGLYAANRLCRIDDIHEEYWAHGSGRQAALAAMRCGKSAIEAVRVASAIDTYTGGRIVSETLRGDKNARTKSKRR